jgi:hypothetical protein
VPESALALLLRHSPPVVDQRYVHRYDLRGEQSDPAPKSKVVKGKTKLRAVRSVDSVCLHQTATPFSVADYQVKAAGGDRNLALARRALKVACHAMAFRAGFYAMTNDLREYIHHAGALNSKSLGLEIEGLYAGIEGNLSTVWGGRDPQILTGETIAAARAALTALVEEGRALGMPIRYIYAHRQSSAARLSDPGEDIWQEVALAHGVANLGLEEAPSAVFGDGNTIPVEWSPHSGVGRYVP